MKSVGLDEAIELYLSGSTVEEARGVTTPPIDTVSFYKGLEFKGIEKRGRISRRNVLPDDADLECQSCGETKCVSEFSKSEGTKIGYDSSRCKACKRAERKAVEAWANKPMVKRIFDRVKGRAVRKGISFDLELEDIIIPDVCPVFKVPFIYGDHSWTYSLDRIKPELGYVKGNVVVISNKANMMKNTATTEDVRMLYEWMLTLEGP